jgi:hypothetical protein
MCEGLPSRAVTRGYVLDEKNVLDEKSRKQPHAQ